MADVYVTSAAAEGLHSEELAAKSAEKSPTKLVWEDCCLLVRNLPSIINTVRPLRLPLPLPGMQPQEQVIYASFAITGAATLLSLPGLVLVVPMFLILPGWTFLMLYVGMASLIALISRPTWGSFVLQSRLELSGAVDYSHERWLFINGIAVSHGMMQSSVDMLSATFKRPVIGIHNRSWGLVIDLLECLIQRCFRYNTQAVRISYEAIRDAMLDEKLEKVVVIAHSQGGILVSLALDSLYATMPAEHFRKLEIYTFGSAASDFHNPLVGDDTLTPTSRVQDIVTRKTPGPTYIAKHLVKYIEHYCNGKDMVPRWGVMYHINQGTSTSYSGRVFRHEKQTGHLFDQHYLELMFPLLRTADTHDPELFLNHVCKMSDREAGILNASTFGPGSSPQGQVISTVRDLSRLWRYVDGESP